MLVDDLEVLLDPRQRSFADATRVEVVEQPSETAPAIEINAPRSALRASERARTTAEHRTAFSSSACSMRARLTCGSKYQTSTNFAPRWYARGQRARHLLLAVLGVHLEDLSGSKVDAVVDTELREALDLSFVTHEAMLGGSKSSFRGAARALSRDRAAVRVDQAGVQVRPGAVRPVARAPHRLDDVDARVLAAYAASSAATGDGLPVHDRQEARVDPLVPPPRARPARVPEARSPRRQRRLPVTPRATRSTRCLTRPGRRRPRAPEPCAARARLLGRTAEPRSR